MNPQYRGHKSCIVKYDKTPPRTSLPRRVLVSQPNISGPRGLLLSRGNVHCTCNEDTTQSVRTSLNCVNLHRKCYIDSAALPNHEVYASRHRCQQHEPRFVPRSLKNVKRNPTKNPDNRQESWHKCKQRLLDNIDKDHGDIVEHFVNENFEPSSDSSKVAQSKMQSSTPDEFQNFYTKRNSSAYSYSQPVIPHWLLSTTSSKDTSSEEEDTNVKGPWKKERKLLKSNHNRKSKSDGVTIVRKMTPAAKFRNRYSIKSKEINFNKKRNNPVPIDAKNIHSRGDCRMKKNVIERKGLLDKGIGNDFHNMCTCKLNSGDKCYNDASTKTDDITVLKNLADFRDENYFKCHSADAKLKQRVSAVRNADHECKYEFYLNERLFAVPVIPDCNQIPRCSECYLPVEYDRSHSNSESDTSGNDAPSISKDLNGVIRAKVLYQANSDPAEVTIKVPVSKDLFIKERCRSRPGSASKESEPDYGCVRLDYRAFLKSIPAPDNSLALRYQKGYQEYKASDQSENVAAMLKMFTI